MNDTEKTKDEIKAADEQWAVLPFDEKEDDERWDKLIAETDELAQRAAAIEWDSEETSTEEDSPGDAAASESATKSADDELAGMNPF